MNILVFAGCHGRSGGLGNLSGVNYIPPGSLVAEFYNRKKTPRSFLGKYDAWHAVISDAAGSVSCRCSSKAKLL